MTKFNNDLITQMRKDLFAAYRDVTSKPCPNQKIAYMRTVKHPAPRYYIEGHKATGVMYWLLNGEYWRLEKMHKKNKERYLSLFRLVIRLSQKPEFIGKSLLAIVEYAVKQPAPEFFISWETFKQTFRNAKRYGIDFWWMDAIQKNKQYTNMKDNKPRDAVYKGKKHIIINT